MKGKNLLIASEATVVAALQQYFDSHLTTPQYGPEVIGVRAEYQEGCYVFKIELRGREPEEEG